MANSGLIVGLGVLVVVIVIGAAALFWMNSGNSAAPYTTTAPATTISQGASGGNGNFNMPVMITDPAQVPAGTSALVFTYSQVQVNSTGPSGSQWVNATGSGSVNLISVINNSQVIAYANLSANSSINQVRFLVNSVQITVNGSTYSVPVSNPQLTLTLSGNITATSGSGVLIDYTPTVSPAFNANATAFVRVPSGKAVVTGNIGASSSTNVGLLLPITVSAQASLAAVTPNLVITSATVSGSENTTTISVTVQNSGNQSVTLSNLVVYGQQNVNTTASLAASAGANSSLGIQGILGGNVAGTVDLNLTALLGVGVNIKSYAMQNFAAGSGGSLVLVTSSSSAQTSGTQLNAGSSTTLTYSGVATYNSGTFQTTPMAGAQYRIVVGSKSGASASIIVTAS